MRKCVRESIQLFKEMCEDERGCVLPGGVCESLYKKVC